MFKIANNASGRPIQAPGQENTVMGVPFLSVSQENARQKTVNPVSVAYKSNNPNPQPIKVAGQKNSGVVVTSEKVYGRNSSDKPQTGTNQGPLSL